MISMAKQMNRRAIGFDIIEDNVNVAKGRLVDVVKWMMATIQR